MAVKVPMRVLFLALAATAFAYQPLLNAATSAGLTVIEIPHGGPIDIYDISNNTHRSIPLSIGDRVWVDHDPTVFQVHLSDNHQLMYYWILDRNERISGYFVFPRAQDGFASTYMLVSAARKLQAWLAMAGLMDQPLAGKCASSHELLSWLLQTDDLADYPLDPDESRIERYPWPVTEYAMNPCVTEVIARIPFQTAPRVDLGIKYEPLDDPMDYLIDEMIRVGIPTRYGTVDRSDFKASIEWTIRQGSHEVLAYPIFDTTNRWGQREQLQLDAYQVVVGYLSDDRRIRYVWTIDRLIGREYGVAGVLIYPKRMMDSLGSKYQLIEAARKLRRWKCEIYGSQSKGLTTSCNPGTVELLEWLVKATTTDGILL